MVPRWSIVTALVALVATGCNAGAGSYPTPPAPPGAVPSVTTNAVTGGVQRAVEKRVPATPVLLLTGLTDPTAVELYGGFLYVGDIGSVVRVHRAGGAARTVLTGTALFDSGANRGVDRIAFAGHEIFAGFGGYVTYDIVKAPIATGVQTPVASFSGGDFIGRIGLNLYSSHGFCCIDAQPVGGGPITTVQSGVWVRTLATDTGAIYFIEYFSRDLDRFDVATGTLTHMLTGNGTEGKLVIDATSVFYSAGATIQAIPKNGGPATTIYTGTQPRVLASDGKQLFFEEGQDIKAMTLTGGAVRLLLSGVQCAAATTDAHHLYYIDSSKGVGSAAVYRLVTNL